MYRKTFVVGVLAATVAVLVFALPALAASNAATASTVTVTLGKPSEFGIALSKKSVPAGKVTFKVTNKGAIEHDFKIGGKVTKNLKPGQSALLVVKLKKTGKSAFLCTLPSHAVAGMKGALKVT